jgi:hypothetical protein
VAGRAYGAIRSLVEDLGGSMAYEREGHRHGAWVIRIGARAVTVEANAERSFPELDRLHVPCVPHPRTWDDYLDELVPDAKARLLKMLDSAGCLKVEPPDPERLAALIEHAKWRLPGRTHAPIRMSTPPRRCVIQTTMLF